MTDAPLNPGATDILVFTGPAAEREKTAALPLPFAVRPATGGRAA